MEKLISLMEDLAMLNSQLEKYRSYASQHSYVNQAFIQRIDQMESKKKMLEHDMEILYLGL